MRPALTRASVYLAGCLVVGAAAGVVWRTTTVLPFWTVTADGTAQLGDRALVEMFGATARYVQLGLVGGLLLGLLALALLRHTGWRVVVAAVAGALVSAGVAWVVGVLGGPSVQEQLATAPVDARVPVALALGTPVAALVWPFLAMAPVLLWSAFAPDPDPA